MSRLAVQLNRLKLKNPILVASGTFGYAKEMAPFVPFEKLGGIIPKTVTAVPRIGNPPPRTVETYAGMLNSIGLDNDGIDTFIVKHVPYLSSLGTAIIANVAGKTVEEFEVLAAKIDKVKSSLAGLELNISCPNVSGGVDFGTIPEKTAEVVRRVRQATDLPIIAKLTPNVTKITDIAQAAAEAGADAVSLINTILGMAVDWKRRRPILGNNVGGLSGPAIKPVALRIVWQVAQAVKIPIIGVGGISSVDDVLDFMVTGASAVQIGTANFYNPSLAGQLMEQLDQIVLEQKLNSIQELIGTLQPNPPQAC
jgi:dihydroorotate dehydrogenase (NAD+) catalytic subunit